MRPSIPASPSLALGAAILLGAAPAAHGEPAGGAIVHDVDPAEQDAGGELAPRTYVNFRIGGSTGNENGKPDLCLEGAPLSMLSLETCGTGAGILHDAGGIEMFHLRAKWTVADFELGPAWLAPGIGAGMSELQLGVDDPGFRFGDTGNRDVETAGPEAVVFLRGTYPLPHSLELVMDAHVGLAYLPYAPELLSPQSVWQPFGGASLGVGF